MRVNECAREKGKERGREGFHLEMKRPCLRDILDSAQRTTPTRASWPHAGPMAAEAAEAADGLIASRALSFPTYLAVPVH